MIFAETYLEILSSPAHMLAELTVELLTGCILFPIGALEMNDALISRREIVVRNH